MTAATASVRPSRILPPLEAVEAELCRRSLRTYVERAWAVVEPAVEFVPGWHIDAICEHLEAVSRGEITRLLINIPPRHMKSLTVSVFWPTWSWARAAHLRFVMASYIQSLAVRDCVKSRRLIQSLWYQARFGGAFHLTSDQNEKTRYDNDGGGFRVAYSVGGATGEGGDVAAVDDPHNMREGESGAKREGVLIWWDEVISTRLDDPHRGARVIVMQRLHERDLSGHVLAQGGYEHLCLPAEYEGKPCVTVLGSIDRRSEANALLWPAKFDRVAIEQLKVELGPHAAAGQLQQRPTARTGGAFERGWFALVDDVPRQAARVRYWDKAATPGGGKYTAGCLMAGFGGRYWIEDVVRGQWSVGVREQTIQQVTEADAARYGLTVVTVVEQEPGSGGKESAQATIKLLAGFPVYADRPTGDKLTRAHPLAASAAAGNVMLLRGPWNEPFLREVEAAGPGAAFMDQVDAAAGAFNKLALGAWPGAAAEDEVYDLGETGGFVL